MNKRVMHVCGKNILLWADQSGVDRNAFSPNTHLIVYPSKWVLLPLVFEPLSVSWPQLEAAPQKNDWQLDAGAELKAVGSRTRKTLRECTRYLKNSDKMVIWGF